VTLPALLGALFGLIVGSFAATLVVRWPERSVLAGRSSCDNCGRQLSPFELVPLVSYMWNRGRCARCSAAIAAWHPAIEAVAALIGGAALWVDPGWGGVAGALFGWTLLTIAALDLRHRWLPDRLTLPLLVAGLGAGALGLMPPLGDRVIGAAAGFGSLWLLAWGFRRLRGRDGLGGGDPKLLGAIGAWLGWAALPDVVLVAALGGLAVVAVLRLLRRPVAAELPLGTMLAAVAFGMWLVQAAG